MEAFPMPGDTIEGQGVVNPIENGVQQAYQEIREALELLLSDPFIPIKPLRINAILTNLDDAVSNNWDELMLAFWRGVKQDVELLETST